MSSVRPRSACRAGICRQPDVDPALAELRDWLGHDEVGHKTARVLHRAGYDVTRAETVTLDELARIPGFGPGSSARWTTITGTTVDTAPDRHGRTPRTACSPGSVCGGKRPTRAGEVYDWWGHDSAGHRIAGALVRAGYETVAAVTSATAEDLLAIPGVGPTAIEHWRKYQT